jgi:hypothetical protein
MLKIKYDLFESPEETVTRWKTEMQKEIRKSSRAHFAELAVIKRENEELKIRLALLEKAICQN